MRLRLTEEVIDAIIGGCLDFFEAFGTILMVIVLLPLIIFMLPFALMRDIYDSYGG